MDRRERDDEGGEERKSRSVRWNQWVDGSCVNRWKKGHIVEESV